MHWLPSPQAKTRLSTEQQYKQPMECQHCLRKFLYLSTGSGKESADSSSSKQHEQACVNERSVLNSPPDHASRSLIADSSSGKQYEQADMNKCKAYRQAFQNASCNLSIRTAASAFRCLDGGAGSKATQFATWALANMLVDNLAAQVSAAALALPIWLQLLLHQPAD